MPFSILAISIVLLIVSHLMLFDTAPRFDYFEEIGQNAVAMGATPQMLEVLAFAPEMMRRSKTR